MEANAGRNTALVFMPGNPQKVKSPSFFLMQGPTVHILAAHHYGFGRLVTLNRNV